MTNVQNRLRTTMSTNGMPAGAVIACLVLTIGCVQPTVAEGDGWFMEQFDRDRKSAILGFLGGVLAHELGHVSVAVAEGTDFEIDGLSIVYPESGLSDRAHLRAASGGFQMQWLATEIAFRYLQDRDSAEANAAAGVVLSHLGVTAAYLTFLKNHGNGDIEGMSEASGISNDKIALAVAIPAVLDAWRLFGRRTPGWVSALSASIKGAGIVWVWSY